MNTLKVLVVDDDPGVRALVKRFLRSGLARITAYEMDEASDGQAGLEVATLGNYDLVITDVNMPRLRGDQMISRLREGARPDQAVVLMSGNLEGHDDEVAAVLTKYGDIPFVSKPLRHDEFTMVVLQALGLSD